MANASIVAQAALYSAALKTITGETPSIKYTDNYAILSFSPDQQVRLRQWIQVQLSKKSDSGVTIDFLPVVGPLVLQKVLPYILLLIVAGVFVMKIKR